MPAAFIGLCIAAPASADEIPDNLVPSIRYEVSGEISAACGFSQSGNAVELVDLANPDTDTPQAAATDLPFEVTCNTPVKVQMTSDHGGLKFAGAPSSDPDFTTLVRYGAAVTLPGAGTVLTCQSAAMAQAVDQCSAETEQPVTNGAGKIHVNVQPGGSLLLAGNYQDKVTLIITPELGDGGS